MYKGVSAETTSNVTIISTSLNPVSYTISSETDLIFSLYINTSSVSQITISPKFGPDI